MGTQIPFDGDGGDLGEGLAVGLGDVEDADDTKANNPPFFLFTVLGCGFTDDGGEDL